METLVYLLPQTEKHPHGSVMNIQISDNQLLKAIYINEALPFFARMRIRRLIKDCTLFGNDAASKFRSEKVYYDGINLVIQHINELIFMAGRTSPVVVFTCDLSDLKTLESSITTLKNISILTVPQLQEEFDSYLLNSYGIAGAVQCAVSLSGKTAVIMPSGSSFSANGALRIFDLADKSRICKTVKFRVPEKFKGAELFLKAPDALETAMRFFGIDCSEAKIHQIFCKKLSELA